MLLLMHRSKIKGFIIHLTTHDASQMNHICALKAILKKKVIVIESGLKVSQLVNKMYTEISCIYFYCLVNLQQLGAR